MAKRYGDRWEVERSIGEGGQSCVFLVRDSTTDSKELYALKRLKNDSAESRLARFGNEIEATQKISHPGIIKIIDYACSGDPPYYYVMPYYEQGSLESLSLESWSTAERLSLFDKILDATSILHASGIIHRDIKPSNILIDKNGVPVLCDFGICFFESGQRHTLSEERIGSVNYIPPELEGGRLDKILPTADVYCLGKVLYWIMCGQHLPRERFDEQDFNLVDKYDDNRFEIINELLRASVTEFPRDRYHDATRFHDATYNGRLAKIFDRYIRYPSRRHAQRCIFCGQGDYKPIGTQSPNGQTDEVASQNVLGFNRTSGMAPRRIVACDNCGNVQMFLLNTETTLECWRATDG